LVLAIVTSACCACSPDSTNAESGIDVTVTLSRHGSSNGEGGPTFDRVPQSRTVVAVVDAAGNEQTADTDDAGKARFTLSAGEYDVVWHGCGDESKHVRVPSAGFVGVSLDCSAP
jgi:hypothetical protein